MLLVSYDISDDKLRARFSRFLEKFGYRLQYSLFKIKNSERVLDNIKVKIDNYFGKHFKQRDSVMIIELNSTCKITKFGYAKNEDEELIII